MDRTPRTPQRAPESKPDRSPRLARDAERIRIFGASMERLGAPAMCLLERKDAGQAARLDFECEVKLSGEDADGVFEGYLSKWDLIDRGGDIVEKGAFKKSLTDWKRRKAMPPVLWQHDPYTPIGVWTDLNEDDVGLYGKGQLLLDIPQAAICRSLIKAKAVTGLSIGYITKDYEFDRQTGARHLKEVELWEASPVTFPMLPEAQISGVKGEFDPNALERILRDEGRLSIRDAKAAVSVFRKHALRDAGSPETGPRDGASAMLMTLRKATQALRD